LKQQNESIEKLLNDV